MIRYSVIFWSLIAGALVIMRTMGNPHLILEVILGSGLIGAWIYSIAWADILDRTYPSPKMYAPWDWPYFFLAMSFIALDFLLTFTPA